MTLTEFLLARIAEDEEGADWDGIEEIRTGVPAHRWSSERQRAECEAKRRIVNRARGWLDEDPDGTATDTIARDLLGHVVRCLALPFAEHPDYDEAWRP